MLVMPGCNAADALRAVERANESVRSAASDRRFGELSLCAGVAVFPQDGDDFETLFANADSRMYQRKLRREPRASEALNRLRH